MSYSVSFISQGRYRPKSQSFQGKTAKRDLMINHGVIDQVTKKIVSYLYLEV